MPQVQDSIINSIFDKEFNYLKRKCQSNWNTFPSKKRKIIHKNEKESEISIDFDKNRKFEYEI